MLNYLNATNKPFRIGNASFDFAGSLNGKIAYLAVYKGRILTTTELSQLDAQLPVDTVDTVGAITANTSPVNVSLLTSGQKSRLMFSATGGQKAVVQVSNNTLGSVTVSILDPGSSVLTSLSSSSSAFTLSPQQLPISGTYSILLTSNNGSTGTAAVGLTTYDLPSRPSTATEDTNSPLSSDLIGLFVMNEVMGTIDQNLIDGQSAVFSGNSLPTWNSSDPSISLNGGASLNSYLNAGTDLIFDDLTPNRMTIVAKVYVNTVAAAGICEKNDGNSSDSGFVFGWDSSGTPRFTVEKASSDMRVTALSGTIVAGQWIQIAVTWDGTVGTAAAAHIFINGVEQIKTSAVDGSGLLNYTNATNKPFRIGNASFDFAGSLNGKIAYLAVYKGRILTTTELNQLDTQLPIQ